MASLFGLGFFTAWWLGSKGECPQRARWMLCCLILSHLRRDTATLPLQCTVRSTSCVTVSPYSRGEDLRLYLLMKRMSRNLQTSFKVITQGFPEPKFPEPLQCSNTTSHPTHHPMSLCLFHLLSTPNPTLNPHERETRDSRCLHVCTYSLKVFLEQNLNPLPKVNPLFSLPP